MHLNAWFPTVDIDTDPAPIRDCAQAAEDLGYAYIEVPDHALGAGYAMLYPMWQMPEADAQIDLPRRFRDVAAG